jgi:lipid-binding SYLF domain-containing protein
MEPAFYTIASVSFGFQIVDQAAEVVMLAMCQKATYTLYISPIRRKGTFL